MITVLLVLAGMMALTMFENVIIGTCGVVITSYLWVCLRSLQAKLVTQLGRVDYQNRLQEAFEAYKRQHKSDETVYVDDRQKKFFSFKEPVDDKVKCLF